MSESEIKRRQEYKIRRKKWILIQSIAILLIFVIALGSFLVYNRMNRTYYIEYTENGSVDYKVQYKNNAFFEDEWIGSGQSYVSALINVISADFKYGLNMDTDDVGFDYTYGIKAQLIISDKTTGDHIYNPTDILLPEVTEKVKGSDNFKINKSVLIDYNKYNDISKSFIDTYALKNATSMLVVTMNVSVLSNCDEFEDNNANTYTSSLNIPLGADNFSINSSASTPLGESKVLACRGTINQDIFLKISIISAILAALLGAALVIFIYVTKNEDVNYSIKVQKLVRAYRSFIQEIDGEFDTAGYQIVNIKTFTEMLGIRDTIQSPVLKSENRDQTKTQFLIPTNTKILYVFEIKIENYDEIYSRIASLKDTEPTFEPTVEETEPEVSETLAEPIVEEVKEEPAVEEPIKEEPEEKKKPKAKKIVILNPDEFAKINKAKEEKAEEVIAAPISEEPEEELIEEPVAEPDEDVSEEPSAEENISLDSIHTVEDLIKAYKMDSSIVMNDDTMRIINSEIVHIRYRQSFMSRLIQSGDKTQGYYGKVKNFLLSYKGVKARNSWNCESFNKGRLNLAKLNVKGNKLVVYLALNPSEYNVNKYRFKDVSDKPNLDKVPMKLKVKTDRSLKLTLELISDMMARNEIKQGNIPEVDYSMPYATNDELADRGLVKIIFPKGIDLDENTVIKKLNISELLASLKSATKDIPMTFEEIVEEVMTEPDVELSEIDYVDEIDEEYEDTPEHPGLEVVGVVWPERAHKNKIYRYDPNGETLYDGDIVLVPTRDASKDREVVRKAAVAHGNHMINPESHPHALKKVICVVKRHAENEIKNNKQ